MALNLQALMDKQLELNFTPPHNFYLIVERLPELMFTIQRIQIPVLSAEETQAPNPLNPGKTFIPGEGLEYSVLSCDFLVDKHFYNWKSILEWLKGNARPEDSARQYTPWKDTMSNITVIGTDAANTPLMQWHFIDAFPISLDGPMYDATMPDVEYLPSNVTFKFKYFQFTTYTNGIINNDTI